MTEGAGLTPELAHLVSVPNSIGPPTTPACDVAGTDLEGGAVVLSIVDTPRRTLVLFLSSTCDGCAELWPALSPSDPAGFGRFADAVVGVTRGAEGEDPGTLRRLAPAGAVVVMSGEAWKSYRVHGPPFFVLVDGSGSGRVLTEGVAIGPSQVARSLARADERAGAPDGPAPA